MEIMKTREFYTQKLSVSEAELKELHEKGTKALSRYDIEIASGGDADLALRTAKRLVGNHIKYYKRLITEIEKEPAQLELL
jgi:hypothetical protein